MNTKKWTASQRKRFIATMAAKRAERESGSSGKKVHGNTKTGNEHHDAIIYLRHAQSSIMKETSGGKKLNKSQLYTLLALNALQGD
jgi:hypothetical protein